MILSTMILYKKVINILFMLGLEDNSMDFGLEENVSLITLGGSQATVEQYLTNEYQCLRTRLGDRKMVLLSTTMFFFLNRTSGELLTR